MKLATGEEPEGHEGSERRRLWRQAVIEARVQRTRAIACQVILCTSIALSIALSADTRWCRQRSHLTQQSDDVEAALGLLQGLHPSPAVVEKRPALAVTSASLVRLDVSERVAPAVHRPPCSTGARSAVTVAEFQSPSFR